jgi:hypothetical protein
MTMNRKIKFLTAAQQARKEREDYQRFLRDCGKSIRGTLPAKGAAPRNSFDSPLFAALHG